MVIRGIKLREGRGAARQPRGTKGQKIGKNHDITGDQKLGEGGSSLGKAVYNHGRGGIMKAKKEKWLPVMPGSF